MKPRNKLDNKISFTESVWEATKLVPFGFVTSYGCLARFLGRPGASRAVGNALNKNPYIGVVPCHRVVRSSGDIGGFALGAKDKIEKLKKEGVEVRSNKVEINKYLFNF